MEFDPVSLTLDEMLQMDSHALHQMARISAGTLTRYRALLGRLLLAIGRTDAHLELGQTEQAGAIESEANIAEKRHSR